jgi:hypothetical protein
MPCTVKLFEPNSASPPVHDTLKAAAIELVAVNEATKANLSSVETNKALNAMPMCNSMRLSAATPVSRSGIACCTATAQRTASTTLANSTSRPSPVVLTMRPLCSAISDREARGAAL